VSLGRCRQPILLESINPPHSEKVIDVLDLSQIASNLKWGPEGYWTVASEETISYPEEGNDLYYTVEDDSFWFQHRNRVIIQTVRSFSPDGPILDVGGGNGYVAKGLEEANFPTVLVEPGRAGAANARRRGLQHVVCSVVEAAGFLPGSFAGVGLFDVLEHIEDDGDFLLRLRRLLAPGVRIYLTVPAFETLWSVDDVSAGHFRRYTKKTLARVLEQAGFSVEYVTYFFALLPLPVFVCRSLPSFLGWRGTVSAAKTRKEHSGGRGLVRSLLGKALDIELSQIRRRRRIPFGSSCLAVAQLS
jgi:SAM-dependent methyltransferase